MSELCALNPWQILQDKEQQGSVGHKNHALTVSKKKQAYKIKTIEVPIARRTSARLKLKNDIMKGSFWNSNGFKDMTKNLLVQETIRERKLEFCIVIETR
jgi:hypothetical protein